MSTGLLPAGLLGFIGGLGMTEMMIIGAIARMGIVCEVMIQGISERSSVWKWTIPTASATPSTVPIRKPSRVEDSVIQEW